MAKISTTVNLKSSSDVAGVLSLNHNKDKEIDITTTTGEAVDLTTGGKEIVSTGETKSNFVYINNANTTNSIILKTVAGVQWGVVEPDNWAYVTVPAGVGLSIYSSLGTVSTSYLIMTKS